MLSATKETVPGQAPIHTQLQATAISFRVMSSKQRLATRAADDCGLVANFGGPRARAMTFRIALRTSWRERYDSQ
jgi:hypothetical protein